MILGKCKIPPGQVLFFKGNAAKSCPSNVLSMELNGCIFAVDGFSLCKIPHEFTCVIPPTGTLFQSKLVQLNYWWISACWNHDSLKYWIWEHSVIILSSKCLTGMFHFRSYFRRLFAPSLLLSSITFMIFLAADLGDMTNFTVIHDFEFIALHSFTWFGLKSKPHL